jgi:hypothetical protein
MTPGDPFRALGLTAGPGLTDDDIRAAWRRVAAATHPDRADGGDPAAFAAAAGAYSDLRTPFGRNEALAELGAPPRPVSRWRRLWLAIPRPAVSHPVGPHPVRPGPAGPRGEPVRAGLGPGLMSNWPARLRHGRPGRLALRVLAVVAGGALLVLVNGWHPATPALMVGALTWLIRSGRHDLAAPLR